MRRVSEHRLWPGGVVCVECLDPWPCASSPLGLDGAASPTSPGEHSADIARLALYLNKPVTTVLAAPRGVVDWFHQSDATGDDWLQAICAQCGQPIDLRGRGWHRTENEDEFVHNECPERSDGSPDA